MSSNVNIPIHVLIGPFKMKHVVQHVVSLNISLRAALWYRAVLGWEPSSKLRMWEDPTSMCSCSCAENRAWICAPVLPPRYVLLLSGGFVDPGSAREGRQRTQRVIVTLWDAMFWYRFIRSAGGPYLSAEGTSVWKKWEVNHVPLNHIIFRSKTPWTQFCNDSKNKKQKKRQKSPTKPLFRVWTTLSDVCVC